MHYIRQQDGDAYKRRDTSGRGLGGKRSEDVKFAGPSNELARRLFELRRSERKEGDGGEGREREGGRKRRRDDVATFQELPSGREEKWVRGDITDPGAGLAAQAENAMRQDPDDGAERAYKRPSRQVRRKKSEGKIEDEVVAERKEQTAEEMKQMEELAEYLHEAALEEVEREKTEQRAQSRGLERETKKVKMNGTGRPVTSPRISAQRARAMHQRRVASNLQTSTMPQPLDKDIDDDTEMADGDYVYDTYILAPSTSSPPTATASSDVGYLIIHPSDRELWETYIDDVPTGSEEENSHDDDEDENAEDYYGADYPEDELSEEDEFDRGAYGYRGGFGEESDGDERGVWSEEEDAEEGEVGRMMDPFRAGSMGGR